MSALNVRTTASGGSFRIFVRPPGGGRQDVTFFRGVPTQIGDLSTTDPFGDAVATLTFSAITGFDRPGSGDLWWLQPYTDVDIIWFDEQNQPTDFTWEGFMVSEEITDGLTVQCKGALYQIDNFLAAPFFPQYPVPYEKLLANAFSPTKHPSLRTSPLILTFPDNWTLTVPSFNEPDYLWFLRPWGVTPGQPWTGLTTRSTGSWEPMLTGFVQSLLSVMYTDDGGQWTIYKRPGRVPVLQVRPALKTPQPNTLEVYYGAPGIDVSLSRDFTQSANVMYGQGTDLAGSQFSGQQVTPDGQTTFYEPFSALPQYYPSTPTNPRLLTHLARKEARLQFPQGLDEQAAKAVAATQLRRFADPGYVGTITLKIDPLLQGIPFSRLLVKAGQSILLKDFRRTDILFHISQASISVADGTATLTVDTKFRDTLTVAEVKARTRDALDPVHLLQAGKYSTTVQDQIKPWSYSGGSGVVPSDPASYDATQFFRSMPQTEAFPWTNWTTKYPPSNPAYAKYYIPLNKASTFADNNWSGVSRAGMNVASIPIKMSQAGSIRLSQFAAYDKHGNIKPVRFHVSIYANSGASVRDMPMIPAQYNHTYNGYAQGQRYPFYPGAFENINPDGTETDNPGQLLANGADLIIGWGNYYEPAGYSPGLASTKSPKTGKLVDEQSWGYDTSNSPDFDKRSVANTRKNVTAGMLYVMIYCDDQGTDPVYFLGRLFRQEPGT
jgi:hypothetical protein